MSRPDKHTMFMAMAELVAKRSTCARTHVGCIITDLDGTSVVSMGYNGNAAGLKDECDTDVPGACGCIHAEMNALIKAPYQGPPLRLYTTLSPCVMCAKLIINSKVQEIYVGKMYRSPEGFELLNEYRLVVVLDPEDRYDLSTLIQRSILEDKVVTAAQAIVGRLPALGIVTVVGPLHDLAEAVKAYNQHSST